jgi:hypothetical protein
MKAAAQGSTAAREVLRNLKKTAGPTGSYKTVVPGIESAVDRE